MTYQILMILCFVLGYLAIAFEHSIRLNKSATALLTGVFCWTILYMHQSNHISEELMLSLGDISSILFFLLGAMTIVELIDSHEGFEIIKDKIHAKKYTSLIIIIGSLSFFLSALLDNLTTAMVMTSLMSKFIDDKKDKLWFAGLIIISSNAGGAWSPIGDVTTTMLWIGGQITPKAIILSTIIPSLAVTILPIIYLVYKYRNKTLPVSMSQERNIYTAKEELFILISGIILLLFVPIFKTLTGLPPFMGMMLSLAFMWVIVSFIHRQKNEEDRVKYSVSKALQKIDTPSILFFLGILLAVSALSHADILSGMAEQMQHVFKEEYSLGVVLGLVSAIVDNVPLVAAVQKMFTLTQYPQDHCFWHLIALTSGTGGSIVIIGSAAGVAVMGMEEVPFMWYLKRIGWLALLGYIFGIVSFWMMH